MGDSVRSALGTLAMLQGASEEQLERIAEVMAGGMVPAGTVLGREGDAGDHFWLLTSGRVAVTAASLRGQRRVAEAGPGSILGELALLRRAPRSATVTALEDSEVLTGGGEAFERLLSVPTVRAEIRRLASRRLAEDLEPLRTTLRDGAEILVRPLLPQDRRAFERAVWHLSADTRRRRFFSAGDPTPALVEHLVDIDYVDHFAWVALSAATGRGLATARYVVDPDGEAEMAFTTVDGFQGRGLGTFLLGAVGVAASEAGLGTLVAHVMEDNVPMRRVFAKAGTTGRFDEPGVLKVTVDPAAAAAVLEPGVRRALATAVHDVVTAASLALRT